jgi:hypothetical protein
MLGLLGSLGRACGYRGIYPGIATATAAPPRSQCARARRAGTAGPNDLTATWPSLQFCGKSCRPSMEEGFNDGNA